MQINWFNSLIEESKEIEIVGCVWKEGACKEKEKSDGGRETIKRKCAKLKLENKI